MLNRYFQTLANASELIFTIEENLENCLCWLQAIATHDLPGILQYSMTMYLLFAPILAERLEK